MTVTFNAAPSQRPWRGYDDPGLPVGMYFGQGIVTGDASAGSMRVSFGFKEEGDPISGRFFNIEQINVVQSSGTTRRGFYAADNWETLGPVGLLNRNWKFQVTANLNGVAALDETGYFPLPLFLGSPTPVVDLNCAFIVGMDNIDLTTMRVLVQGYIWEARSIMAQGGLRRPVDSLYGGGGH